MEFTLHRKCVIRQLPYKLQLNFSALRFVFYIGLSCVQMEGACCVMCRMRESCTSSIHTAWIFQGLISQQLERHLERTAVPFLNAWCFVQHCSCSCKHSGWM